MQPNKKHIEFIRLVANGETFEKAYVTICNKKTTNGNARTQGSRLAKKFAKQIAEAKENIQKVIKAAHESEVAKNALKSLLTVDEVDLKICSIIRGDLQEVQVLTSTGKVMKAKITPTISEMKAASETFYKRFGSNAPTKTDLTSKGESINPTIDVSHLSAAEIKSLLNETDTGTT